MARWMGVGSFIGLGEETVWGTPVASSTYFEVMEEGILKSVDNIETPSIYNLGLDKDTHFFDGGIKVGGNLVIATPYESVAFYKLLKFAFGEASVTNATIETGIAYSHTFKIQDSLPTTKPGLTLEVKRGKEATNTQSFQYTGCMINSLEFGQGGINEVLKATFNVVGKDGVLIAGTSPSVPTGVTSRRYVGTKSAITWGGNSKVVSNISLTLNNKLSADYYPLGSNVIDQPSRGGHITTEGSFTIAFNSMNEYNDFIARTDRVLLLTADSGVKIGSSSINNYKAEIKCPFALITSYPVNVNNVGAITVNVNFRGLRSGSVNELELRFIDGNSGVSI